MILLKGQGVSPGMVSGPLYFLGRRGNAPLARESMGAEAELSRFTRARQAAVDQLHALAERSRASAGDEAAVLFETHAMLAEDEDFEKCVRELIEGENRSAESALREAGEQFASLFDKMEDGYMRERAADIRDVTERMIGHLLGTTDRKIDSEVPVILAADDLAPSETVQLDKRLILGFATRMGSGSSHTAILARTLGIPAVCALGDSLREDYAGQKAWLDGETGQMILEPDERTLSAFSDKQMKRQEMRRTLEGMRGKEDVTLDGRRINLYCNIASPEDIPAVLENDGQGIGLFRSEFLYLSSDDYPDEERQFCVYRDVAARMNGKPVIIRTLDIGADKQADYFGIKREENPALGLRAIRICLNRPEVFRPQLRALYRASAYGRIAIMFPMIASLWEVRECKRACQRVMAELEQEGIPFRRETELGVMIETPASVLIAGELAREVDFFSVGTNDLTQYMLACDRQQGDLERFFDPHHPAVLRALKLAADAAHDAGIWIGVCGELAADLSLLPTFLAIGVDELSVTPPAVLPLRMEIRKSIAKTCALDRLNG